MMEAEQASYWNGIYAPKLTTGPDEWQSDDILDGSLPSHPSISQVYPQKVTSGEPASDGEG